MADSDNRDTEFVLRLYLMDFEMSAVELTKLLGVSPTYTRTKGEVRLPGKTFQRNIWNKEIVARGNLRLDRHIRRALDALAPLPDRLKALAGKCEVDISCHINDRGKGYVIYCDPPLVRRLAEINASLEVVIHDGVNDPEPPLDGHMDLGYLPEEG